MGTVGKVICGPPNVRVTPDSRRGRHLAPHEFSVSPEAEVAIDYANLDALAAQPGLMPGGRSMRQDSLAGDGAVVVCRRDDFPHPDDPGLLRE